jgi:hypothetical protein
VSTRGQVEIIPNPKPVPGQRACDSCGRHHGQVMAEINCLRRALAAERVITRALKTARDEYMALPTSKGGLFESYRKEELKSDAKKRGSRT